MRKYQKFTLTQKYFVETHFLRHYVDLGFDCKTALTRNSIHKGDGQRAILKREDGRLLKPIQPPPKGPREAEFYRDINMSNDPTDVAIRRHIPRFFGIEDVGFTNGITVTERFLVLEDITDGFVKPNIMDIKIGSQTWGPDASQKKISQEKAKYVGTKGPYGFSILGMLVHAFEGQGLVPFKKFDKSFGKNLKQDDAFQKVPETYFNHEQEPPKELIEIFVEKISEILEVFSNQRKYKIYASSLLLAYDAQAVQKFKSTAKNDDENTDKKNELRKYVNIRLIDFAHVFNANGDKDENFLFGLTNLLDLFQRYLNRF